MVMGYLFDYENANKYDSWFDRAGNRHAFELEVELMKKMLAPRPGSRILDIGCGTGKSIEPFLNQSLVLTGVDPSPFMLDLAGQKLGHRVELHRGFAEDLPFEDNAFDHAVLFTSLEFTDRPAKAVEEACRVAREKVFLGVLNRWAPVNLMRRIKGWFFPDIYSRCKFFGIWELKQMLWAILGEAPVVWRTTPQLPLIHGRVSSFVENRFLVQKSPFGLFIGMVIYPVPKFRTTPLFLKLKKTGGYRQVTGYARQTFQDKHGDTFIRKIG